MHRSVSDTRPSPATGPPRRRTAGGGGSGRARRATSLGRALLGSLILATGLSLSVEVTAAVSRVTGLAPAAGFILQAVLMSAVVVPAILLLRRRVDRAPLAGLGWSLPAVRACLVGAGAAATASTATWVGAWLLGWITVVRVDAGALAIFLAVNTVVLTGYEALPEELSVRGYAWTSLHDGWGSAVATVVTTALFALNSAPTGLLQRVWATLLGISPGEREGTTPADVGRTGSTDQLPPGLSHRQPRRPGRPEPARLRRENRARQPRRSGPGPGATGALRSGIRPAQETAGGSGGQARRRRARFNDRLMRSARRVSG